MASRRHMELLQSIAFPLDITSGQTVSQDDISLDVLRENLFALIDKMPRVKPEKTTVEWSVQETGQILSAIKRHVAPENSRWIPTHLSAEEAKKILSATDVKESGVRGIGIRRFDILQEAVRMSMKRSRN